MAEAISAAKKLNNMQAFDDAFAHVVAGIGGHWDKWKSGLESAEGF
jgi:hypothetical protein